MRITGQNPVIVCTGFGCRLLSPAVCCVQACITCGDCIRIVKLRSARLQHRASGVTTGNSTHDFKVVFCRALLKTGMSRGSSKAVVATAGVVGTLTVTVLARQGWDVQARTTCQRKVSVKVYITSASRPRGVSGCMTTVCCNDKL